MKNSKKENIKLKIQAKNLNSKDAEIFINSLNKLINSFVEKGRIPKNIVPLFEQYINARLIQLKSGNQNTESFNLFEEIQFSTTQYNTFKFYPADKSVFLFEDGNPLNVSNLSSVNFNLPVPRELLSTTSTGDFIKENIDEILTKVFVEVLTLLLSLLLGKFLASKIKGAAKKIAKKVIHDKNIRGVLEALMKCFLEEGGKNTEKIRELGQRLVQRLAEGDYLDEIFDEIFDGMGWWQILILIAEFLMMLLPIGWLAKIAVIILEIGIFVYQLNEMHEKWKATKLIN